MTATYEIGATEVTVADWVEFLNGDGSVNLSDYNTLAGSFKPTGYAGATTVPEPMSLVLYSLGTVLVLFRRRPLP